MKKLQLIIGLILLWSSTFAQLNKSLTYTWEDKPSIHELDEKYEKESAVVIHDNRILEMIVNTQRANTIKTVHKIIRTNTDVGIEKHNRIYIPVRPSEKLLALKVRTIAKDGTVKQYETNNLKKLENINGYSNYQIYAVEGIEKGGEIEYIYTVKQDIRSYGREVFQGTDPIIKAKFELYYTERFFFSAKAYNGFGKEGTEEEKENGKVYVKTDIPAITDEGYSNYKSKLMRVDYRIEQTPASFNIMTWKNVSDNLYENLTGEITAKTGKFLKKLNLKDKSNLEKIQAVEKAIKENITIKESGNENYSNVKFILKNKVGSSIGVIRTYISCFNKLKIPYQIVATTSRFDGAIDEDYATYLDLNTILFYFPEIDKYLVPEYVYLRLGMPPSSCQGNTGLIIPVQFTNGSAQAQKGWSIITTLPFLKAKDNNTGVRATLKLNENLDGLDMDIEHFYQEFRAAQYRFLYINATEEGEDMLKQQVIASAIEDPIYTSFSVENEALESSEDFKIKAKLSSQSMVQSAGGDILVSIGKVIGKQNELYEEQERVTDVVLDQAIRYEHDIVLEIPEGYTLEGLEPLKVDEKIEKEGKLLMRFLSDYTLEGNLLKIKINEDYEILDLDKSEYKDYQTIVNCAANFNKIVLVLTKK